MFSGYGFDAVLTLGLVLVVGVGLVIIFAVLVKFSLNSDHTTHQEYQDQFQPEPGDSVDDEENEEPTFKIDIWRWVDLATREVEHIVITCDSHSGYEFKNGKLTFAWEDDGIVTITSDLPFSEVFDTTDREKQRAWTRVFYWDCEEAIASDDEDPFIGNNWEPVNVINVVLEGGRTFKIESDGYDELIGLDPDLLLEIDGYGTMRITDSASPEPRLVDTDAFGHVIGFGFIERFSVD